MYPQLFRPRRKVSGEFFSNPDTLVISERPNLDFLGSAEPNPNRNWNHRTMTEP